MKTIVPVLVGVSLALACAAGHAEETAKDVLNVSIERESLRDALNDWAQQTGNQLIAEIKGDFVAPKIEGKLTAQEALERLLEGTPLTYQWMGERLVAVKEKGRVLPAALQSTSAPSKAETSTLVTRLSGDEVERVRRAANDQSVAQSDRGSRVARRARETGSDAEGLEEVVVTAQRRLQRLQDVPISISVVSADEIDRRGLVSAEDYLRGIPGVNQGSALTGSSVIIRGLETSPSAQNFSSGPTVATYFGETPTTETGGLLGNGSVDIKLADIERVEVLRGPQGTAFGSSSLGGAVRTIPAAPKLDGFEAKVAANYSFTSGSGDSNFMVQGMGNVPVIEEKLAIRAVAYKYVDSGFYRNVAGSDPAFRAAASAFGAETLNFATNSEEIGESEFTGARGAVLLRATDKLSFTLSYLTQNTEIDGLPLTNTATGLYDQTALQVASEHALRGQTAGATDTEIDLTNLTMEYDFGWASLLGTYSYVESGSDLARPFSMFGNAFLGAAPLSQISLNAHRRHVGEIRLATELSGPWNFLGGLYAEELEDDTVFGYVWHGDLATNPFGPSRYPGDQRDYVDQRNLQQRAAFAEVSWEFSPGWTLTGGGRIYEYDRTVRVETRGSIFSDSLTREGTEESDSNFRANLSYKPNDHALVYVGWAEGFRLGKPQPGLQPGLCDLNSDGLVDGTNTTIEETKSVDSDTVDNTELGGKFTLLDRRLMITAAVFRVDWNGMPFLTIAPPAPNGCGLNYVTNAGAARSEGIESQLDFQVTDAWRVNLGGSYIRARLTEDVPAQGLSRDDRLPGSPKLNANLGLRYGFNIGEHEAFVRADSIYVGSFSSTLPFSAVAEAGDYVKLDFSAGMALNNLSIDLFARNVTDDDSFAFKDTFGDVGYRVRPRTIGLQFGYSFQ